MRNMRNNAQDQEARRVYRGKRGFETPEARKQKHDVVAKLLAEGEPSFQCSTGTTPRQITRVEQSVDSFTPVELEINHIEIIATELLSEKITTIEQLV